MTKAPRLSPRALALTDRLLARLPTTVAMLEAWWEQQAGVRRVEMFMLLKHLDGERWDYDRAAKMVRPMGAKPAAVEPSPQVRAAVSTRTHRHAGTSTPIITEKMIKASTPAAMPGGSGHGGGVGVVKASRVATKAPTPAGESVADMVTDMPPAVFLAKAAEMMGDAVKAMNKAPVSVPAFTLPPIPVRTIQPSVLSASIVTVGWGKPPSGPEGQIDPSAPVTAMVGGVTMSGLAAAVQEAARAYQRALLSPPTTPRPPAKPRQSKPVTGSVSERVRASVCRKPGTVGEVIARFHDVNENTVRGALGTLKSKGLVGHTGGKYGAPRG